MTYLIDRIRMWMCKHEWSKQSFTMRILNNDQHATTLKVETIRLLCTKCGYSKEVKI